MSGKFYSRICSGLILSSIFNLIVKVGWLGTMVCQTFIRSLSVAPSWVSSFMMIASFEKSFAIGMLMNGKFYSLICF